MQVAPKQQYSLARARVAAAATSEGYALTIRLEHGALRIMDHAAM